MFNQWVDGQPWWLTLLLLPALVMAAVLARVLRYAALTLAVALVVGVAAAVWSHSRRR